MCFKIQKSLFCTFSHKSRICHERVKLALPVPAGDSCPAPAVGRHVPAYSGLGHFTTSPEESQTSHHIRLQPASPMPAAEAPFSFNFV